jgi:tRNA 2-thiouridine synthesizing protein A
VSPIDDEDDGHVAIQLLQDLKQLRGKSCIDCDKSYCGHEVLFSIAMGFKDAPRCLPCLAKGLKRNLIELRDQLRDYIQRKNCFRQAWDHASDQEGLSRTITPKCLWSPDTIQFAALSSSSRDVVMENAFPIASEWNAGQMGCGDLVLALRNKLNALKPGEVLKLTALDPAAPEDLPSWCRLTGHKMLQMNHPEYYIQRKEN